MTTNRSVWSNLLQSKGEWATRNQVLAETLAELIVKHVRQNTHRGLDIGCQWGAITDEMARRTSLTWYGVDPGLNEPRLSPNGAELFPGWAHQLPFPDSHFDCVVLANVYEHISPDQRSASLAEINRVLTEGGLLIGQLPNPYFPIESHSRLPFMGWLPYRMQLWYWRLAPVEWKHDFYVVTIKDIRKRAENLRFMTVDIRNFNYPVDVIPSSIRWLARLAKWPMQIFPWAWQFVFEKKHNSIPLNKE